MWSTIPNLYLEVLGNLKMEATYHRHHRHYPHRHHHSHHHHHHGQGCQTRRSDNAACPMTVDISSSVFMGMGIIVNIAIVVCHIDVAWRSKPSS